MKVTDRVYVVEIEGGSMARLVRATFSHMAERHVIGSLIKSRVASKDDLIELLGRGAKVEDARDAAPDPAQPDT